MARSTGWTFFWAFILGIIGTSLFWLYGPYLDQKIARQVEKSLKGKEFTIHTVKGGPVAPAEAPDTVPRKRFLLISGSEQTFLADLQEGRVWRYFHHTREGGWSREEEGFLPLRFYYGGKKYYAAEEVSATESSAGQPSARSETGR